VRVQDRLPEPTSYRDQLITYQPAGQTEVRRKFHHTMKATPHHKDMEAYRELLFPIRAGGRLYTVSVAKSEEETDDLLELMMLITPGMILLLLGTLLIANRLLLRRLWRPFYETLEGIRRFNLSSREPLPVRPTDTEEFRDLNGVVRQMTEKILKDYEMLKGFTENASHEMQTPLAIINSRLDLLIQDMGLGERHHQSVQAMYSAIGRLRQLNQSLLLLMKIENNQFGHTSPVDLAGLVCQKLAQLEDQLKDRGITVTTDLHPLLLPINDYLADILLNNLLLNAIRHNRSGGRMEVRLGDGSLRVSNTGPVLGFDPATIFNRFTKGAHSGGTGLGLAIVKQICDSYGFAVSYSFADGMHSFRVDLSH
jgi:signal transduction histidine kinase